MLQSTKLLFLLALTFNALCLSVHEIHKKGPQTKGICPESSFQLNIPKGDGVHDHVYYIVANAVPDSYNYEYVQYLSGQDL